MLAKKPDISDAFFRVIGEGKTQTISAFMKQSKPDPNVTDRNGLTPLMVAAQLDGDRSDIIEALFEDPRTDPNNITLDEGIVYSAYSLAKKKGNIKVMEKLLEKGALKIPLARNQDNIKQKIMNFLALRKDILGLRVLGDKGHYEDEWKLFIRRFDAGYCAGISAVWLYSEWLEMQPKTSDLPRDDYTWFRETVDFIATWEPPAEKKVRVWEKLLTSEKWQALLAKEGYVKVKSGLDALCKLKTIESKEAGEIKSIGQLTETDHLATLVKQVAGDQLVQYQVSVKELKQWMDDKEKFERFISLIQYFQHIGEYLPVKQGELAESLEDTVMGKKGLLAKKKLLQTKVEKLELQQSTQETQKELGVLKDEISKLDQEITRELRKEYAIASLFTLRQLKMLLNPDPAKKELNIIQDGKLILIISHNHATALMKKGEYYYYFDPNSITGQIVTTSTDRIAELIFNANFGKESYNKSSPLEFSIFSFDKGPTAYPAQENVLNTIDRVDKLTLGSESLDYADGLSGLMIAAREGSLESARYLLAKGADPNLTGRCGTALTQAASRGNFEIVKILVADKKTKLLPSEVFLHAILAGRADIVKILLKDSKAEPYITSDGCKDLVLAAEKGYFEIVAVLLADPRIKPSPSDFFAVFQHAAAANKVDVVEMLFKNTEPETIQVRVKDVVKKGKADINIIRVLLELKNDQVKSVFKQFRAPLLLWAVESNNSDVVKMLLKNGVTLDKKQKTIAMNSATKHNQSEILSLLSELKVSQAANIDKADEIAHQVLAKSTP